jgi:nucleoid DNA-binding protein
MTFKQFSNLYAKTYKISKEQASNLCKSVVVLMGKVLYVDKEDLIIHGFGSLKHIETKEKRVRHPKTKEMTTIPSRQVIKFKEAGITLGAAGDEEE